MENLLDALFSFLRRNAIVFYAGIGMGIYRCVHEWPVWFNLAVANAGADLPFSGESFFVVVDAGKVAGLVAYIALCYAFDANRRSGVLLVAPSALMSIGFSVTLFAVNGFQAGDAAVVASLVVIGAGAGMLFGQWIEFCGCLPPIKVIQVFTLSFVVKFLLLPVVTGLDALSSALFSLALGATSFVQVAFCFDGLSSAHTAVRTSSAFFGLAGHGRLFLFVTVFAFAYGLGGGATQLSHSAVETGWGTVLPSAAILVLAFKMGNRFDWSILYAIALPLMTAGLMGIEFLGASPSVSQVVVSAAYAAFDLIVYTMVCADAYRSRASSLFSGSCIRILALVAADAAVALVRLGSLDSGILVTGTILAALAAGIALFLPQLGDRGRYYRLWSDCREEERAYLEGLARDRGLSQREATVFQLLVAKKSVAEISEELFISNGAVRAHCSRIYDKFGVHSRKGFDSLFD